MNAQRSTVYPDVAALQAELDDLRETLRAIRAGEVDAIVVESGEDARAVRIYALETAERPYRVFLEAMQEGAVTAAIDGTILYTNRGFAQALGASGSAIIGRSLRELVLEDDGPAVDRLFAASEERATAVEVWLDSARGPLPVLMSASRLVVDDMVAICIVVTDLTEAKRVEKALREAGEVLEQRVAERTLELSRSEQRFRSLVTATTAIIWSTDAEGAFVMPQWSWQAYTGHAWERHRGWSWADALHPDDRVGTLARWRDALARCAVFEGSARIWHGGTDGYRHCNMRAVPVFDGAGTVREWIGCCDDVDDARRADEALRESEQRLKDDDRRKDEFIATLAHELRNPLAPIRNAAKVLELSTAAPEETRWAHEVIGRQVAQMARLLDDLLDVSRITQNKLELESERVLLGDMVRSAVETSMPLIREYGCELSVELPVEPVVLDADPTRLSQILLNLLNNAAKYNKRGGRIALVARREAGEVAISIADEGIGIATQQMPSIFDMFTQLEGTPHRSRGGLGIGLALVRRLAAMHGGSIEATSAGSGQGSMFTLRLPLPTDEAAPAVMVDAQAPALDEPRRALRIVVADDNIDSADSLALLLEIHGHEVCTVYDGRRAVEETVRLEPHLVLLDIGMPRLDGYGAARAVRLLDAATRPTLIALTGWGQEQDKQRAADAGFDSHITKPVDLDALLEAVDAIARGAADVVT